MGLVTGYEEPWRIAGSPARGSPCQRGSLAVPWRCLEAGMLSALRDQARFCPLRVPADTWLRPGCLHMLPLLPGLRKCRHRVVVVASAQWPEATLALLRTPLAAPQPPDAEYLVRASPQDLHAAPPSGPASLRCP